MSSDSDTDTESIEMQVMDEEIPYRPFHAFEEDRRRALEQLPTVTRADACKHWMVQLCRSITAGLHLFASGVSAIYRSSDTCVLATVVIAVALLLFLSGFLVGFIFAHIYPNLHLLF
jgi:hypothetical protein